MDQWPFLKNHGLIHGLLESKHDQLQKLITMLRNIILGCNKTLPGAIINILKENTTDWNSSAHYKENSSTIQNKLSCSFWPRPLMKLQTLAAANINLTMWDEMCMENCCLRESPAQWNYCCCRVYCPRGINCSQGLNLVDCMSCTKAYSWLDFGQW